MPGVLGFLVARCVTGRQICSKFDQFCEPLHKTHTQQGRIQLSTAIKVVSELYVQGITVVSMTKHDKEGTTTQEAFQTRMRDQCQQIERYRLELMRNEGRLLSHGEAARQWIDRYAEYYAPDDDASDQEVIVPK